MRIRPHLIAFAVGITLASTVSAQIRTSSGWVQGAAISSLGLAHTDINIATGKLSAWCDYRGLEGDLAVVEILTRDGASLGHLAFNGQREGLAFGTFDLAPSVLGTAAKDGFEMRFRTAAFPDGEMSGWLSFQDGFTEIRTLSSDQVVGSVGATGTMNWSHMTSFTNGRVLFSGSTQGLDLPFTGLELHGAAWYGENAPMVLDLAPHNQSNLPGTFILDLPPGTLTADEHRDLLEGFQYLLIKTAAFPEGALRAQTTLPSYGQNFCPGLSNSSSPIGGRLRLTGSPRISTGTLALTGQFFPQDAFVLPLAGRGAGHVFLPAQSEGVLCLGGAPLARLIGSITQGQGLGTFSVPVDLGALPPEAGVAAGIPLNFQCWHRDVVNGIATSNFSNAVRVRPR